MTNAAQAGNDPTILILFGVCGLCIVTLGVVAAVFFVFFRFAGKGLATFFVELLRGSSEGDRRPLPPPIVPPPDFRQMASTGDFEAKLAQNMLTTRHPAPAQPNVPPQSPASSGFAPGNAGYPPLAPSGYQAVPPPPPALTPNFPVLSPQDDPFRGARPSMPMDEDVPDDLLGGISDDLGL